MVHTRLALSASEASEYQSKSKLKLSPKKRKLKKSVKIPTKKMKSKLLLHKELPPPPQGLKYTIELEYHRSSIVSTLNKYDPIIDIRALLSVEQLSEFSNSCFGKFLNIPNFKLQNQLIHNILIRQLKQPNPNELWIGVGGVIMKFRLQEFATITGLLSVGKSNKSRFSKTDNSFVNNFFGGAASITKSSIKQAFFNRQRKSDVDAVKAAKLYLLHHFLLTINADTQIPKGDFDLLDCDQFDDYPWGKEVFKFTLDCLRNNADTTSKENYYRLNGFPYALQVWFYECCPYMNGKYCDLNGGSIPRVLNWTCDYNATYKDIYRTLCINAMDLGIKKFVPSAEEVNELQLNELLAIDSNLDVTCNAPTTIFGVDDFVSTIPPSIRGASSSSVRRKNDISVEKLEVKMRRLESSQKSLVIRVKSLKSIVFEQRTYFDLELCKLRDFFLCKNRLQLVVDNTEPDIQKNDAHDNSCMFPVNTGVDIVVDNDDKIGLEIKGNDEGKIGAEIGVDVEGKTRVEIRVDDEVPKDALDNVLADFSIGGVQEAIVSEVEVVAKGCEVGEKVLIAETVDDSNLQADCEVGEVYLPSEKIHSVKNASKMENDIDMKDAGVSLSVNLHTVKDPNTIMSDTETPTKPTTTEEPPKTQIQSRYETIRVPILRPSEYPIWKVRMTMFLEATDPEYLDRIKEGPHKPTKLAVAVAGEAATTVPKEKSDYTAEDIASIAKDAKVRHLLHSAIDNVMSNRVINCKTAKEIWDALETRCQGTDIIKKNRKTILTQEYEHFDSKTNESLNDLYDRFVKLLNDLSLVDKEYDLEDSNLKFLLALPECWDLKATTIRDNYNLDETTLDEIYGMLKTHELEMEQRSKRKGGKSRTVALKAEEEFPKAASSKKDKGKALFIKSDTESSSSESDDDSDSESLPETDADEEMMKLCALMVKGITKIAYRKFRKGKKFPRKSISSDKKNFRRSEGRGGKSNRGDYTNVKCYNCGEKGHISPDCKKVKGDKGKALVTKKKSWTDTSDSESEENYALMANADKESAESSSEAAETKVPQTTYAFHTDDINELRRYLKIMFVSYRDQTLTCERLTSENLAYKKRNDFLEKELVIFHQTQKDRDDAFYVRDEVLKMNESLKTELEKEREIIRTWTNSGRTTQNLLSSENWKEGLGYGENKNDKGTEEIKPVVKQKPKLKPVKFVTVKSDNEKSKVKEELTSDKLKQEKTAEVNIGLMIKKQLKHKLKDVKNANKVKSPRKNRNGKEGVNKSNDYKPVPDAPRKTCHNCGSSNHLAFFCRKNKNINSLPSKSGVKSQSVRYKPQNPCFHCGSLWHSIYTCKEYHSLHYDYYQIKPSLKKVSIVPSSINSDSKSDNVNSDKKNVNINSDAKSAANGNRKNILVLDSRCSGHMTGNKALLSDFVEKAGPSVSYGDGNIGKTLGYGNINLGNVIIKEVALVSGLKHNLLSISQICDRGYHVDFFEEHCEIVSKSKGKVVLKGYRRGNIYEAKLSTSTDGSAICLLSRASIEESWNWHKKLSHLNFNNINELVKKDLVRGLPNTVFAPDGLCDSCQKAKQRKSSFKSKTESSILDPYHLIHVDLFGPVNVMSIAKKKYALVIVDEFTRYTWVYFLHTKSETASILIDHVKQLDKMVKDSVKILRSDNGTEFKNLIMEAAKAME
ncbi:hypothetical protein AgCh_033279 [Apium graveolens]